MVRLCKIHFKQKNWKHPPTFSTENMCVEKLSGFNRFRTSILARKTRSCLRKLFCSIHCMKSVYHFSVFSPNVRKCWPEKLRIRTLFTEYHDYLLRVRRSSRDVLRLRHQRSCIRWKNSLFFNRLLFSNVRIVWFFDLKLSC